MISLFEIITSVTSISNNGACFLYVITSMDVLHCIHQLRAALLCIFLGYILCYWLRHKNLQSDLLSYFMPLLLFFNEGLNTIRLQTTFFTTFYSQNQNLLHLF